MRSNLIIVATAVAGMLFAPLMASADPIQEQLRLMEQRMAEMEDRLQATSVELQNAKATVDEQQGLLTDAGLVDASDEGVRSGVGSFFESVEVSGHVATSYNNRIVDGNDNNNSLPYYAHPNANTFSLDQFWLTLNKTPTEESRSGFHADIVYGVAAGVQGGSTNSGLLYSAYVSYLADWGRGAQIDMGKLPTLLGAEVLQQNANFNVTRGLVYGLQPITHTGIIASGEFADGWFFSGGIVNDIPSDTSADQSYEKAITAQIKHVSEKGSMALGVISGQDESISGNCGTNNECETTVIDFLMTANPSESVSLWLNADVVGRMGHDLVREGYAFGVAGAGRLALSETCGISGRLEWVRMEEDYLTAGLTAGEINGDLDVISLTKTLDMALTDNLTVKVEGRWDRVVNPTDETGFTSDSGRFENGRVQGRFNKKDVVTGIVEAVLSF